MLTRTKRRILFYTSIIIFLLLLIPVIRYSLGYGTGGIFISSSQFGADVYVGKKHKKTSLVSKSALIKNLAPGIYKVSIKKEGFWEWQKNLEVNSGIVTDRNILLIPKNVDGKILGTSTPAASQEKPNLPGVQEFWPIPGTNDFLILGEDGNFYRNREPFDAVDLLGETVADILRGKKQSIFDESFSRLIYWDQSVIDSYWFEDLDKMPRWQKDPLHRIGPTRLPDGQVGPIGPIRQVFSYPAWADWLIVEMANGVFALEIDTSGGQNIFPMYKGKKPEIVLLEPDKILIKDDGNFIEIELP